MDAIVGMEGFGPAMGYPVRMNLILAGTDVVAVDTVATQVMGINVNDVKHLVLAGRQGLGISEPAQIEIRGENLHDVRRYFRKPRGLKGFEVYGKTQYRIGRLLLNHFNYDIRPVIRNLSLFHLPKPKLDHRFCDKNGNCISICPESAISMRKFPTIDYSRCSRCMLCYERCPEHAFSVSRLPTSILKIRNSLHW